MCIVINCDWYPKKKRQQVEPDYPCIFKDKGVPEFKEDEEVTIEVEFQDDDLEWAEYLLQAEEELEDEYEDDLDMRYREYLEIIKDYSDGNDD